MSRAHLRDMLCGSPASMHIYIEADVYGERRDFDWTLQPGGLRSASKRPSGSATRSDRRGAHGGILSMHFQGAWSSGHASYKVHSEL